MYRVGAVISGVVVAAPVVSVRRTAVKIKEIHFATSRHGNSDFHFVYLNSNTHATAPGNLQWWARGSKITDPEWANNGAINRRACFTRKKPVAMSVKLVATTTVDLTGSLTCTPTLDGSSAHVQPATVSFTYPAGAAEHWVNVILAGTMPDEIGRYGLALRWSITGATARLTGTTVTRHHIYTAYDQPLEPSYDSAAVADTGSATTRADGTLTGTQKRLDHLMLLIGGANRRHRVTTTADLVDLYWNLHKGINDTPGAPPYFDAGHDEHMTHDGTDTGTPIPLEDQWLGFVSNSSKWNDCSCIGHVQIAKTMLAAVGLFARRTWVFPHTKQLPDGTTASFPDDTAFYCLGTYDTAKQQSWTFHHGARTFHAVLKLMEPGIAWENFEACMLTPTGKFLTGGYATSSNPASFRTNKGFNSAAELLRWWANTSRSGFGRRFQCWLYYNRVTGEGYVWDVEGTRYAIADYVQIRTRGKTVPPP